jgi:hypothetical protein
MINNRFKVPHDISNKIRYIIYFIMCTLIMCFTIDVQANTLAKRLAVLAVQSKIGKITQQQLWSDRIRMNILREVKDKGIWIIDQSQMSILLPNGQSLDSCIDDCEVQIARKIGAHWIVSTSIYHIEDTKQIHINMKLYDARGYVIHIDQDILYDSQKITHHLDVLSTRFIRDFLHFKPTSKISHTSDNDLNKSTKSTKSHYSSKQKKSNQDNSTSVQQKNMAHSTQWIALQVNKKTHYCLSAWITSYDYQQCVHSQKCDTAVSWGNCRGKNADNHIMNCLNLKQAIQVSQWLQARLLEPADLSWIQHHCPECLHTTSKSSSNYWSWMWGVNSSNKAPSHTFFSPKVFKASALYKRDKVLKQAQAKILLWNTKQLKSNKKALIFSHSKTQTQLKNFPAAFQASHVAVRVIKLSKNNQCN